ncbi:MAG: aldehyde dehydrogenase family protein [Streptomyces sp.]|nr:aldehyde dehydrogenase family protein [Streptomyces sp.]NUS15318.1 aldehyde dehydrogenase family protein [Streptomyces sp.]
MLTHFINGRPAVRASEDTLELVAPATGEAFGSAPVAAAATVDEAFAAAKAAGPQWARQSPGRRSAALLRLAEALERHGGELTELECRDTGKPPHFWAAAELAHCVDVLKFTAGAARVLPGTVAGDYLPGMTSWLRRDPVGVVTAIVPWNFPLMMAIWKIAPILAVGNTCVLKPAPQTPHTAVRLAQLADEAGIPPGVLNVLCGDGRTGRLMAAHPDADMIAFTGSVATGRQIAAVAAEGLVRTHLELGGKAPAVVLGDLAADPAGLSWRVDRIREAALFNAGQSCTSAARVIAVAEVYDDVVEHLAASAAKTSVGPGGDYGALISREHLERVHGFVERRPPHTRVVTGGRRIGEEGFFYAPTVIAGVRADDELAQEEVFGPVVTVQRAEDEADAIRLANSTRYALAASVWTADHGSALRAVRRLAAGDTWVNTHGFQVCEMPHGGRGASGHGSDLSVQSLLDYTHPVHVASVWE